MAAPGLLPNSKDRALTCLVHVWQADADASDKKHHTNKYRMQATDSSHAYTVAENYLDRDFQAARPAEKWVSALTYIRTGEGWLYLTAILDLADRKVVDWALSETMEAEATNVAAWRMAVRNRPLFHSLLFHSDRGVQYACRAFQEQLEGMPVVQSMSRKGNC